MIKDWLKIVIKVIQADSIRDKHLWPQIQQIGQLKVLLTDPPYALGSSWKKKWHGNNGKSTLRDGVIPEWDNILIDQATINGLIEWADIAIIWGGNYYNLPPTPVWFIWDKLQSNRGSDAEMAWTNAPLKGVKVFRMSRIDAYFNKRMFEKQHVAEKPVQLMVWCLEQLKLDRAFVFDPFMGCGGSIVAAKTMGYDAVGIDLNPKYVEETQRRIATIHKET